MNKFAFLKSVRFWKLVIVGAVFALNQIGIVPGPLFALIQTALIGSVMIRTIDRFSEKIGR